MKHNGIERGGSALATIVVGVGLAVLVGAVLTLALVPARSPAVASQHAPQQQRIVAKLRD